jgi:hypothetical protein
MQPSPPREPPSSLSRNTAAVADLLGAAVHAALTLPAAVARGEGQQVPPACERSTPPRATGRSLDELGRICPLVACRQPARAASSHGEQRQPSLHPPGNTPPRPPRTVPQLTDLAADLAARERTIYSACSAAQQLPGAAAALLASREVGFRPFGPPQQRLTNSMPCKCTPPIAQYISMRKGSPVAL